MRAPGPIVFTPFPGVAVRGDTDRGRFAKFPGRAGVLPHDIKLIFIGMVSLVVALGGFLMGFDAGVTSGTNPFYRDYFFLSD